MCFPGFFIALLCVCRDDFVFCSKVYVSLAGRSVLRLSSLGLLSTAVCL